MARLRRLKANRKKGLSKKEVRRFEFLGGTAVLAASVVVVVMFLMASALPYTFGFRQSAAVIAGALARLANGDRVENGLSALVVDPRLTAVAQAKADDMARGSYFAHISPDGKDPWYWFQAEGYAFQYAGENLAVDFNDSIDVEQAWMNSPTHRKNILDPHYTHIGIATAVGEFEGHPTVFVVQAFGTPINAPEQPPVRSSDIPEDPELLATATTVEESAPTVLGAETETAEVVPATVEQETLVQNPIAQIISSPKNSLRMMYYIIGFFVLMALAYTTRFEMKKHHIRHASAAGGIILLMGVLFMLAEYVVFTPPTIPTTAASAERSI